MIYLSPRTLSRDTIVLQILICHQHHVIPVGLFKVRRIFLAVPVISIQIIQIRSQM